MRYRRAMRTIFMSYRLENFLTFKGKKKELRFLPLPKGLMKAFIVWIKILSNENWITF